MITAALGRLAAGDNLSLDEMADVIDQVMQGGVPEGEIAVLLTALKHKGETVDEIAGAALAMRRHMTPIRTNRSSLVDTCGTGGDGSGTFNISTAAAIVAAAAGASVAKHGNRSITSKSGSADVLAALGVNIEAPVPVVERCLNELGICFCFAPHLHPAMKHVAPVRKKLGVPTIFNLLGPLCNPAAAPFQVLGVGKPELHRTLADVLARLGCERAVVVHGAGGLDEVALDGPTDVIEIRGHQTRRFVWKPEDFGLSPASRESMLIDGPAASAALIRRILDDERGPPRDVVVLNAAAALWTIGLSDSTIECAQQAAAAIDTGAAAFHLARWAETSHQPASDVMTVSRSHSMRLLDELNRNRGMVRRLGREPTTLEALAQKFVQEPISAWPPHLAQLELEVNKLDCPNESDYGALVLELAADRTESVEKKKLLLEHAIKRGEAWANSGSAAGECAARYRHALELRMKLRALPQSKTR
jgi:anthranilate phosphoribosyltransferase